MKKGIKVRTVFDGKIGISKGPVFIHSVWWTLVEWSDGSQSIVTEQSLEIIDENR